MGIDYSYNCTSAKKTKDIAQYGTKELVLCDLTFEDEHDHELAPQRNVLMVLDRTDETIEPCQYPEDVLAANCDDADWTAVQKFCDKHNHLPYGVYNQEDLYEMLCGKPEHANKPYNDKLDADQQISTEEKIAALISEFQEMQVENDDGNGCDDHTLTEEDCADLGRRILNLVLQEFRPDLFA